MLLSPSRFTAMRNIVRRVAHMACSFNHIQCNTITLKQRLKSERPCFFILCTDILTRDIKLMLWRSMVLKAAVWISRYLYSSITCFLKDMNSWNHVFVRFNMLKDCRSCPDLYFMSFIFLYNMASRLFNKSDKGWIASSLKEVNNEHGHCPVCRVTFRKF